MIKKYDVLFINILKRIVGKLLWNDKNKTVWGHAIIGK